jgi:Protein of unknown function (DUF2511)
MRTKTVSRIAPGAGPNVRQKVAVIPLALLLTQACGAPAGQSTGSAPRATPEPGAISRQELGEAWPLTVDDGILECHGAGEVTFSTNGHIYAVNGLARGNSRYEKIDAIWASSPLPGLPQAKKSIGPLIDRGLNLCR